MAFPSNITAVMTGASTGQLSRWRQSGLLMPEENLRPALYSFRDLVALRTIVRLRAVTSLQKVRKAFANLDVFDLTEHPSNYKFAAVDGSIVMQTPDGQVLDLVKQPGQEMLLTFEDVFKQFTNMQGKKVKDFRHPRKHLEVNPRRMGGLPTITGTRVPYDEIVRAIDGKDITAKNIADYYPGVDRLAVRDAFSFDKEVRAA